MGTFKPLLLALVSTLPVSGFDLGPPSAILDRLISENAKTTKTFTLAVSSDELITVNVEDFDLDQRGFSMTGKIQGMIRSDFILRGDATDLYGWVVLWDRNAAFEYTIGEGGSVSVEPIPVEKVFPVCDLPDGPEDANMPAPAPLSKSSALSPDSAAGLPVFIRPYPGTSINKLQSEAPKRSSTWISRGS
jgi:hypothetical protein